ncbi:unnamed protein product [Rangifer tarandus platyrhynchus]|uniref:Uncharacterized protein n=2 Tax=Rangifer tarandus platyrhynchus TaxID=3082113 RepID=A0ACB0F6G0_RANTA|nr:unnamed protein product [Rangifer tarandus platyrhynchus]CAI9708312.1 unnamed protein product [Rangifer tarandus platyrhynchus]
MAVESRVTRLPAGKRPEEQEASSPRPPEKPRLCPQPDCGLTASGLGEDKLCHVSRPVCADSLQQPQERNKARPVTPAPPPSCGDRQTCCPSSAILPRGGSGPAQVRPTDRSSSRSAKLCPADPSPGSPNLSWTLTTPGSCLGLVAALTHRALPALLAPHCLFIAVSVVAKRGANIWLGFLTCHSAPSGRSFVHRCVQSRLSLDALHRWEGPRLQAAPGGHVPTPGGLLGPSAAFPERKGELLDGLLCGTSVCREGHP